MKISGHAMFLAFVIVTGVIPLAWAGGDTNRDAQKNVVSLSLFDQQVIYSLNYDRNFSQYFAAGVSASALGGGSSIVAIGGIRALVYPVGGKTVAPFVTAGIHGMTGNDLDGVDTLDGGYGWGAAGVGVEYRNGLVFRGSISTLFNTDGFLVPWPGLTVGYAF